MTEPRRCDMCTPNAAYEKKNLVPSGLSGDELFQACACKSRHRHCLAFHLIKRLAEGQADWSTCQDCKQQFKLDERTRVYIEGAASQAVEMQRIKEDAGDTFNTYLRVQDLVGAYQRNERFWALGTLSLTLTIVILAEMVWRGSRRG